LLDWKISTYTLFKKASPIRSVDERPLHNSSIRHSGLDPESRKPLIIPDSGACPGLRSGIRRNDIIAGFIQFCKGLDECFKYFIAYSECSGQDRNSDNEINPGTYSLPCHPVFMRFRFSLGFISA
jgi:hypothetical protein